MTKENSVRLLNHYKSIGRTGAYEDMKAHILKGHKYTAEEKENLFPIKVVKATNSKEKK